jgi:lipoic acid synthetase
MKTHLSKPDWLKKRLPSGHEYEKTRALLKNARLHTVCQGAQCPNLWECFSQKTATFMIMGERCTRTCRFCAVDHGPVGPPDPDEPVRVAAAVRDLSLKYVVVTAVTRDDLPDGGAGLFAQTVLEVYRKNPETLIEVLVPDFQGSKKALRTLVGARPEVVNHNIETVPRLYAAVRPEADYQRSLELLRNIRFYDSAIYTKSGIMLGLGESDREIRQALLDLLEAGCSLLTLGQYLQPTRKHLSVQRYVHPEEFEQWRAVALKMGFAEVVGGPFVRSSYQAHKLYQAVNPSFS